MSAESIIAVAGGIAGLMGGGFGILSWFEARKSNSHAVNAVTEAKEANRLSKESDEKAQTANSYASEANQISIQALKVSERSFRAQFIPDVEIGWGRYGSFEMEPPTDFFTMTVVNKGHVRIVVEAAMVWFEDRGLAIGFAPSHDRESVPFPVFPCELDAGRSMELMVELRSVVEMVAVNAPDATEPITLRIRDETGSFYSTESMTAGYFLDRLKQPAVQFRIIRSGLEDEAP